VQRSLQTRAGYQAIAPLFLCLVFTRQSTPWPATLVVIGTNGNGLQFRPFNQAQRNAHIVKPFLQFAVHMTPPSGKYPAANF
jgi:hypothetical protein